MNAHENRYRWRIQAEYETDTYIHLEEHMLFMYDFYMALST